MTITESSRTPANNATGVDPATFIEIVLATDTDVFDAFWATVSGNGFGGTTPLAVDEVFGAGFEGTVTLSDGDQTCTIRIRQIGGWDPNTNYGVSPPPGGLTDNGDFLDVVEVGNFGPCGFQTFAATRFATGDFSTPEITTTTLPDVYALGVYSETVEATGGVPPLAWAIASGSLPDGLTIDSATGEISGTVTGAAGLYSFFVEVTDDDSETDLQELTILVSFSFSTHRYGRAGEDYSDPQGIPPIWYHADFPLIGPVFAETLRIGYAVADRHGRTLTRSSTPPALLGGPPESIESVTWADFPFGRGWPYVPEGVTHIVGYIDVETFTIRGASTIDFRVLAGSDTGLAVIMVPPTSATPRVPGASRYRDGSTADLAAFLGQGSRSRVYVEVELSNEEAGQRIQITPQYQTGSGGNVIRPWGAHFWWEVRR